MTARCGGATSSNRPEYGRFIYMAPAQIGALMNNIPTPWAVYFAGAIGSITYDLSTFCTTDPPADPGMGLTDWVALLNPGTLEASITAKSKLRDWMGHYFWDQLCKCDDGTVPTPYSPPAAPTGLPVVNDPAVGPAYPTGGPCQTWHYDVTTVGDGANHTIALPQLPVGWTSGTIKATFTDVVPATGDRFGVEIDFRDPANNLYGGYNVGHSSFGINQHNFTMVNAHDYRSMQIVAFSYSGTPSHDMSIDISVNCGDTSPNGGGAVATPCPTDPFTQMQLDQLLQLVTLIQRQAAPFAYIFGSDHSGLTDTGHVDVQGLLGCKVTLDSIGGGTGSEAGDPDEVFEAGWITWGNADGSTKREWISHSPFVSLPALAGQYTRIGYTLRAGVSATITELVREP